MKKIIPFLSFAIFAVACNSAPKTTDDASSANSPQSNSAMTTDTTGLSQFQSWKAQHELTTENNSQQQALQSAPTEKQTTKVIYVPVQHSNRTSTTSTSHSSTRSSNQASSTPSNTSSTPSNNGTVASTGSGTSQYPSPAPAPEKKKISKAVKGAVIGGVAGGVAGAVLDKNNRVAGGVVGAVLGAGGGWVIGKGMDKKDQSTQGRTPTSTNNPFPIKY